MPITIVHESLPYIDPDPTPTERAAAEALIAAERALVPDDPHHALLPLPPTPTPFLTPLLTTELTRLSSDPNPEKSKAKLSALDFTRYEALDPPDTTSLPPSQTIPLLQDSLTAAYTSHTYISARRTHLALLDSYGKNAWLVGNHQLEGELKALERELADAKREVDLVTLARKEAQDAVAGEVVSLGEAWKTGVGRVLETEAAVEGVRREVLGVRRLVAEGE